MHGCEYVDTHKLTLITGFQLYLLGSLLTCMALHTHNSKQYDHQ